MVRREKFKPSYLLIGKKEMEERIEKLYKILEKCELCPRKCHVNRLKGEKGVCLSGEKLKVSSYFPHFGEEDVLVGTHGSGTIFLSNCNLKCIYCQNYEISHLGEGEEYSEEEVAEMMLYLQKRGCHNINLVTPTHFAPQLVKAIGIAGKKGLEIPIVWNCGGYENVEVIKLLEGIVDIYMPDIKYGSNEGAKKYSNPPVADYWDRCREAVKEMHRQVGDLKIDERGLAYRGLLIRHLVLPRNIAESEAVLNFIAKEISPNSYVNIMSQYYPAGEVILNPNKYPELRESIREDYLKAIKLAIKLGLTRGLEERQLRRI
ncbi:MAG: radical SAM protein [Candidatus Aenigmatarchaeota archaeon]